jgi:hypothetical protein
VRDLGSKNGTLLDGKRLAPGARVALAAGARFEFGGEHWSLVSDAQPKARAVCVQTGRMIEEDGEGTIVITESPRMVAVVSVGQGWMLVAAEDSWRPVSDREVVAVEATRWTLELPPAAGRPTESTDHAPPLSLDDATFRFRVSRDGEHVAIELRSPTVGVVRLPSRAHQQVLLTLAQARVSDTERGMPPSEAGWVYADDLPGRLAMDRTRVNLELFRARKLLEQHGLDRPEAIVERRVDTQQLRLGVERIEIETA